MSGGTDVAPSYSSSRLQEKKKKKYFFRVLWTFFCHESSSPATETYKTRALLCTMTGFRPTAPMPMGIHRLRYWWIRGWRDRVIGASGAATFLLVLFLTVRSWTQGGDVAGPPQVGTSDPALVDLTLVRDAKEKGAVCLDGSPPGYHFQRGYGSGSDSWLLHIEGGGWCNTLASCFHRKGTALGSSSYMEQQVVFTGILSPYASQNPDFYNWNKIKIRYCDGASFSGNVESELQNGRKLYFRGQVIWSAIMDELLLKGLANAKQAFLTGCSAGGLASFLHCDNFRSLLPRVPSVKCLSDGGFFIDEKDISGKRTIRSFYDDVVHLQDVGKNLNKKCTSRMEATQCFFAQEIVKDINTPFFIINSAYDVWQIQNILVPEVSDPQQYWQRCKLSIYNCDTNQIKLLQGFRNAMVNALSKFQHNEDGGMFINSCFIHCQTMNNITWHSPQAPRINNKTMAEAVGDWYFNRRTVKEVDCAYPCNPTCYNVNYTRPLG